MGTEAEARTTRVVIVVKARAKAKAKVKTETKQHQINCGHQNSFDSAGVEGAPAERKFSPVANEKIRWRQFFTYIFFSEEGFADYQNKGGSAICRHLADTFGKTTGKKIELEG